MFKTLFNLNYRSNSKVWRNFSKRGLATELKTSIAAESSVMRFDNKSLTGMYGWDEVCGIYEAKGGEQYMTIGNFSSNDQTDSEKMKMPKGLRGTQDISAYYYLDEFSVKLITTDAECNCGVGEEEMYSKMIYSKKVFIKESMTPEEKVKSSNNLFVGDDFIFMSGKDADNFQLASVNINTLNFNAPKILFKEKEDEVIETYSVNKDAIYVSTSKFGIEANLYKVQDNKTTKINLPKKAGRISLSNKSIHFNDLWISISGWTSSNERYKYDNEKETFTEAYLTDKIEYPEFENIVVEEISVPSHDGASVPLSIIYNKNIKKDGSNPSFFYGYGAYGDGISPFFSPIFLQYVKEGGILCIPHVRGGGEKGEAWRLAGFKANKPNTWKDLIACVKYMVENKYTSKERTAIYSGSAGGIMVGRAMTERPDLFAAVISEAGVLNPIRMETQPGAGGSNIREFGTVTDSTECMALIEMDAYLHVKDSTDYPATYLTVGMNDPRVVPWESGKFAARLQNTNSLKKPVFLYADFDTGHSGGSGKKVYEEWGNVFAFALWQTGHPDYQLKSK